MLKNTSRKLPLIIFGLFGFFSTPSEGTNKAISKCVEILREGWLYSAEFGPPPPKEEDFIRGTRDGKPVIVFTRDLLPGLANKVPAEIDETPVLTLHNVYRAKLFRNATPKEFAAQKIMTRVAQSVTIEGPPSAHWLRVLLNKEEYAKWIPCQVNGIPVRAFVNDKEVELLMSKSALEAKAKLSQLILFWPLEGVTGVGASVYLEHEDYSDYIPNSIDGFTVKSVVTQTITVIPPKDKTHHRAKYVAAVRAAENFSDRFMRSPDWIGIQGVGIRQEEGEWIILIWGERETMINLPDKHRGHSIKKVTVEEDEES